MAGPKILLVDDNTELLALLSKLLEDAGYTPMPFSRGKPAVERARLERPALAVLDVLLPDIMGYEVAAVCRKELAVPVVFITGVFKGGGHAADARTKYDALAFFEKPFEASRLLEVIGKAVAPVAPAPPRAEADVGLSGFDSTVTAEDQGSEAQDPMVLTGRIRLKDASVSATLSGNTLTAAPRSNSAPFPEAITPGPLPAGLPSASGDLRDQLPSLVTAFYQAQKTGELLLTRGKILKVVYFEQGQPVFALSNVAADRFGQFLVRVGKIKEPQLAEAVARAKPARRRTGDVLLEMGLLKDAERLYFVGQQIKAIIYSLFAWEDGRYQISFQDKAVTQAIKLDIPPAMLIQRGVKKLYKPERLRRLVGANDVLVPSQDPPYQLTELQLEPWEAQLFANVDGKRTVTELIAQSGRSADVVLPTLAALLALNFAQK
jgi:DNA-binding response OmpR family regulator